MEVVKKSKSIVKTILLVSLGLAMPFIIIFLIMGITILPDVFKSDDQKAKESLEKYGMPLSDDYKLIYKCSELYNSMYVFNVDEFSVELEENVVYCSSLTNKSIVFEEEISKNLELLKTYMEEDSKYQNYEFNFDKEYYYLYAYGNKYDDEIVKYDLSYVNQYGTSEIFALYYPQESILITFLLVD
jgi:hypothetical protein